MEKTKNRRAVFVCSLSYKNIKGKIKQKIKSFLSFRKMKSAGLRNKVIQNKLKEYVPIKDVMLRICI